MMKNRHSSAIKRIETKLKEVSFLKLILFVVPVSMVATFLYLVSSDILSTITYTFEK